MKLSLEASGITVNDIPEIVILLPPGPITRLIAGSSGQDYQDVLVYDPTLGRPTNSVTIHVEGDIYSHI